MQSSEFLFPNDLQVTPTNLRKILFIGSCLSEAYCVQLRKERPDAVVHHILFNNAVDLPGKTSEELREFDVQYVQLPLRSLLSDGFIRLTDPDKAGVDWLGYAKRTLDLMLEKALAYNNQCGLFTLVSNFIVPQGPTGASLDGGSLSDDIGHIVRELNKYLAECVKPLANVFIADVEAIACSIGKRHFLDDTLVFHTHGSLIYPDWAGHERYPFWTAPEAGRIDPLPDLDDVFPNKTYEFFGTVFRQIEALYRTVNQIDMVKLVIFDLDNTLWRGQLVEHYQPGERWPYFDGWPLGVWEAVHILKRRGIMVSISSKNDHDYVKANWENAAALGFLKFDDFIVPKINWKPKAENILEIMQQLSLTAKSVVFVDDNPVERESVAAQIPGIRVMGSNPFLTRRILLWSPETQVAKITAESARREDMLKAQVEREAAKDSMSREEFLQSLKTELEIWPVTGTDHASFSRVLELVNKTNQFNTTGRRWAVEDYSTFFSGGGEVYAFRVKDRFTDYGTVGVIFVKGDTIIQFVMSCRVLGMEIETTALQFAIDRIRRGTDLPIKAAFSETESNTPCRALYPNYGFERSDGETYLLSGYREAEKSRVLLRILEAAG